MQVSFFKQVNKKSQLTLRGKIVTLLFLQVQYIDLSNIVAVVKALIIVISVNINLSCSEYILKYT